MKIPMTAALLRWLAQNYPQYKDWQAYEAPSRPETNNLNRAGFLFVVEQDGIRFYARSTEDR